MTAPAQPVPAGLDWEELWHAYQDTRMKPNGVEHWDKKAASYGAHAGTSREDEVGAYERIFLERAAIRPGETVLDMGCGVGLLSVPLARMGCRVVCADFSARMLEELDARARRCGVRDMLELHQLAWDDPWEPMGLGQGSVDVAIASRSIATYNLTSALTKLDTVARRRACVTIAAGRSPMHDERAYDAVGRERLVVRDFLFVTNILFAHGIFPELSYLVTHSLPAFADHDEAFARLARMLGGNLSEQEEGCLHAFLNEHYALREDALPGRAYESDARREVRWAFIAWGDGSQDATDEWGDGYVDWPSLK